MLCGSFPKGPNTQTRDTRAPVISSLGQNLKMKLFKGLQGLGVLHHVLLECCCSLPIQGCSGSRFWASKIRGVGVYDLGFELENPGLKIKASGECRGCWGAQGSSGSPCSSYDSPLCLRRIQHSPGFCPCSLCTGDLNGAVFPQSG